MPRSFAASPEECHAGPGRILGDEGLVAVGSCAVVVAAQDHPFRELARDGIGQRGLQLRRFRGLPFAHKFDDLLQRLAFDVLHDEEQVAFFVDADVRALLEGTPLEARSPTTVTTIDEVIERIAVARELGAAVVDEEFEQGLVAVAAPVRDGRGRIVAAINLSGPRFRFHAHVDEAVEAVRASAAELSSVLAGQRPDDEAGVPAAVADPED